jgi:hypothetical protein
MKETKTLKLIRLFKPNEILEIRHFIRTTYFNPSKKLVALFDYILQFSPDFDADTMTYEAAYEYVYPHGSDQSNPQRAMGKISSKLNTLLEKYIEVDGLQKDFFTAANYRKEWFRQRGESDWEFDAIKDMDQANQKQIHDNEVKLYHQYRVAWEYLRWETFSGNPYQKLDFLQTNERLDEYYLRAKLETLCHRANHALLIKQKEPLGEEVSILEKLLQLNIDNLTNITLLWYKALVLLLAPDQKNLYYQLKSNYTLSQEPLSTIEKRTFFHYLSNCARYCFTDAEMYSREIFELYQMQRDQNILLTNNFLGPESFYNIITTAIYLKEIHWATAFFEDYKGLLHPNNEKSGDMKALCESYIAFEHGSASDALDLLNATHFKDIYCKLSEKRLRLKVYIELDLIDLCLDHINSFRKFLSVNNDQIAPHHLEGNRAFINYAMAMQRSRFLNPIQLTEIVSDVKNCTILPERNWLLSKLETTCSASQST